MATIIEMPKLSDTMTTGTVVKWHKKVGDVVSNGDIIAEIETDKATMELENFDDGVILKLFADEGDEVEIGKPLAVVGEEGEAIPEINDLSNSAVEAKLGPEDPLDTDELPQKEISSPIGNDNETASLDSVSSSKRIIASPLAKKIAEDLNIDLSKIIGTGPGGRITRKDLPSPSVNPSVSTVATTDSFFPKPTPQTSVMEEKRVPVSKMRSVIAKRLLESKVSIPHFYLQKEIDSRHLRLAREAINSKLATNHSAKEECPKVSINDLILKACADAIPRVPEINTSWEEDHILFHGKVDLAFGVAVEGGLVTPVIRDANRLDLLSLSNGAKLLIEKARLKKLGPDEMTGSTFTVTNLGMFGIDFFSGIINPPNAAILSVGSAIKKAVPAENGMVEIGERLMLGLSCDHRLVDGAVAATFLNILANTLECPATMLV